MKRKLLRPVLWLMLAVGLPLAPALLPPPVHAMAAVAAITTYYSDASHTTVVGMTTVFCDGTVSTTGTVTEFRTHRIFECAPM